MAKRAEPRIIDFSECGDWGHRVFVNALLRPRRVKGPTRFVEGEDGKLTVHTGPVPEWRINRARRILWECQQQPDWACRRSMFFRHSSLADVPYPVLKQLVRESEARRARK